MSCFWTVISKIADFVTIIAGIISCLFIPDILNFFKKKINVFIANYLTNQSKIEDEYKYTLDNIHRVIISVLKENMNEMIKYDLFQKIRGELTDKDWSEFIVQIESLRDKNFLYYDNSKIALTRKSKKIQVKS